MENASIAVKKVVKEAIATHAKIRATFTNEDVLDTLRNNPLQSTGLCFLHTSETKLLLHCNYYSQSRSCPCLVTTLVLFFLLQNAYLLLNIPFPTCTYNYINNYLCTKQVGLMILNTDVSKNNGKEGASAH